MSQFDDGTKITSSSLGETDYIFLRPGDHVLIVKWAGSPGDADLQVSGDGVNFVPARDAAGPVNVTSDFSCQIAGGVYYRMSINSNTSELSFSAHLCVTRSRTDYLGR